MREPTIREHCPRDGTDKAVAHVSFASVGGLGLLTVVLRYSRATWARWMHFNAPTSTFGRALIEAAWFFGGAPRRWVVEEPDCRVLHWDGRSEHFADFLQAVAQHMGSSLSLWHGRYRGPATAAGERLIGLMPRLWLAGLPDGETVLAHALDEISKRPHSRGPHLSIAQMLAEERSYLLSLPASWSALDVWLDAGEPGLL